jgi:putative DNA methylase
LASSIVLVCKKRDKVLPNATKKEFIASLNNELPVALKHLQEGNTAPVDMAQSSIGPGMAVYTRFSQVLDAEGKIVSVRDALTIINEILDKTLAEQEGDFDTDTRFALAWFEQNGFDEGAFGEADVLARAKVTSVDGLVEAGVLKSSRGKVRLLKADELPAKWDPEKDDRLTVWECVHHLIKRLKSGGESTAAELVAQLGSTADIARELAYRLYSICEKKKRAQDALSYNALVQSWPEILRLSKEEVKIKPKQTDLFEA